MIENVSDVIFSLTPEGNIELLNRGFSGFTRDEIMAGGLSLMKAMHAPGEAVKFEGALEEIIRTRKPIFHLKHMLMISK